MPACPSSGQGHSPGLGAVSQDSLSPSAGRANALEEQLKEQELRACEMVLEETRKQKELLCKMEREKSIEIENLQARCGEGRGIGRGEDGDGMEGEGAMEDGGGEVGCGRGWAGRGGEMGPAGQADSDEEERELPGQRTALHPRA